MLLHRSFTNHPTEPLHSVKKNSASLSSITTTSDYFSVPQESFIPFSTAERIDENLPIDFSPTVQDLCLPKTIHAGDLSLSSFSSSVSQAFFLTIHHKANIFQLTVHSQYELFPENKNRPFCYNTDLPQKVCELAFTLDFSLLTYISFSLLRPLTLLIKLMLKTTFGQENPVKIFKR